MAKKIEFKDQYKHPKWQKKRLEVLERDKYTCLDCGATDKQLHVHHGYYKKNTMLWEYTDTSLWTLCSECHEVWDHNKNGIHGLIALLHLGDAELIISLLSNIVTLQNSKNRRGVKLKRISYE